MKWSNFIRDSNDPSDRLDIDAWTITSLTHKKCFHFSPVFHEFLELRIKSDRTGPAEVTTIQVERMVDGDCATAGWKWTQPPELKGWWIKRLTRGDYNPKLKNRRALNFSASDFLCSLEFSEPMSLRDFANIIDECIKSAPVYDGTSTNCFWFADKVYERSKAGRVFVEERGGYFNLKGKFAGLDILSWNIVSVPLSPDQLGSDFEQ